MDTERDPRSAPLDTGCSRAEHPGATRRCPGCGLERPTSDAAYDGYFNASPECWSLYTEVLGAEFQNALLFAEVHQLSVDAYAVQHAGGPQPDKSVDVHLVGLHLVLERGLQQVEVPRYLQRLAGSVSRWPHFALPEGRAGLTVLDVAQAGPALHARRAREWAEGVWSAWSLHHAGIATLAAACFADRGASYRGF